MGKRNEHNASSNTSMSSVVLVEPPSPDVISISSDSPSEVVPTTAQQFRSRFHEHWQRRTPVVDELPCATTAFRAFRRVYLLRSGTKTNVKKAWRSLLPCQRLAFHVEAFVAAMSAHKTTAMDEQAISHYFSHLSNRTE